MRAETFQSWDDFVTRRLNRASFRASERDRRRIIQAEQVAASNRAAEIRRERAVAKLRAAPKWVAAIITETIDIHGVMLHQVYSDCRPINVVRARHAIYYKIKETKPGLSFPQIATWFGRDHTTIMHGIACHADLNNLPPLSGYDLERTKERNRQISARMRASS